MWQEITAADFVGVDGQVRSAYATLWERLDLFTASFWDLLPKELCSLTGSNKRENVWNKPTLYLHVSGPHTLIVW